MKLLSVVDLPLLVCLLLLTGIGGAVVISVAPELFPTQVIFYLFGFLLFVLASRIDYRVYKNLKWHFYIAAVALLVVTLILGSESRGATRWIALGSFRLQLSEIVKPFLVLSLASFLVEFKRQELLSFVKALVLIAIPAALVFKQPDLGTAIVYTGGFLAMIFASGFSLVFLIAMGLVSTILAPVAWHFLADYQKTRLISFLAPDFDPQGVSYNAIQAVITVGSGMLFGRGFGQGTQSQLAFLPEKHTDFIFASLAEEFGLLGSLFLLVVYFFVLWRIFTAATKISDLYASLVLIGLGGFLLVQVFVNVGMNLGILPVTGITLPLISYGGSSILATFISLGIVENIVRSTNRGD